MSAPFTTDDALAVYMAQELGPLGVDLGIDASSLSAATDDALYAYFGDEGGVVTDATNVRKLRALARVEAWRTAVAWSAADFDNSADGESLSLSQRNQHAVARLADALARAAVWAADNAVIITSLTYAGVSDPFARAVTTNEFG